MQLIRSILFIPVFFIIFSLYSFIAFFVSAYLKSAEQGFSLMARYWARHTLKFAGVSVSVKGLENIPAENNFIFASNHQSMTDILLCIAYIPRNIGFLAKKSLFKIPFFGWILKQLGCLPVDRTNARRDLSMLDKAADSIKQGQNLIVFPEGTRSRGNKVSKFKRGGLILASKACTPIIPTGITNSYKTLKKGSIFMKPAQVTISFAEPIEVPQDPDRKKYKEILNELQRTVETLINPSG